MKSLKLFSIKGRLLRSDLIKYWKIICCDVAGCDFTVMFQRSLENELEGTGLDWQCLVAVLMLGNVSLMFVVLWFEMGRLGGLSKLDHCQLFKPCLLSTWEMFFLTVDSVWCLVNKVDCTEYHLKGCILDSH